MHKACHPLFVLPVLLAGLAGVSTAVQAQETRSVTDATGTEVVVPAAPARITVLDPLNSLEALLSLGVAPNQIGQRSFVAKYLGDANLQWPWLEAALVGLGAEPLRMNADEVDLEAVASGEPDLIIGNVSWLEETRTQTELIAPVVATPMASVRETIVLLGETLGLALRAEEVLAAWDGRIASEIAGLAPEGATVAVLRSDDVGSFAAITDPSYGPLALMLQAGFELVPAVAEAPVNYYGYASSFSLERLDVLAEADVLVVLGFSVAETEAFLADPLVQSVPAVAGGRVLLVEQGAGAQAMAMMSPLNFDVVKPFAVAAAELARSAP
jgi:iron complex transport system substrate-binding protein